jgi:putative MATE family efflux protein
MKTMQSAHASVTILGNGMPALENVSPAPSPRITRKPVAGMLDGPIIPALLRLAAPTLIVLLVQTFVSVAETYFVGFLGTEALAGVALVFPVLMLMTMMSNGGIGGGVASAVARAMGASRMEDADALTLHALILAVAFGLAFTIAVVGGRSWLYGAIGGSEATLTAALRYSNLVFGAAVLTWVVNLLSAALRGAGDVKVPALLIFAGAVMVVPLSPALIFGFGPIPSFGIAGAGLAVIIYYALATAALMAYMRSARSPVRLAWHHLEWRLFKDILGVGGLSAIGSTQLNLAVAIVTALVGLFGSEALAGYGMASRLDYLMIPLLFGLGTGTVTMVGTNIGAGNVARARKVAWTAAVLAAAVTETIGVLAALFPNAWVGMFSDDPAVIEIGAKYLGVVGPVYGFVGLGMLLYFAAQGAKRVGWPVLAGTARLVIAAGIGWFALRFSHVELTTLFVIVAIATVLFGGFIALAMSLQSWNASTSAEPSPQNTNA